MAIQLITAPTIEPVTYQQVIDHLRINSFDEAIDESSIEYIDNLISAVRRLTEDYLNRALITQTWEYYLNEFPDVNYIVLPKPPLQSITSICIITEDEPETIDPIYYLVDTASFRGKLVLNADQSWPTQILYEMNPIHITFVCGYGDLAEDVPAGIRHAILLQVGDLYDNREDYREAKLSKTSEKLLWPYRVFC
jgi:uncharacterized phiE125 gp8 family phage protein